MIARWLRSRLCAMVLAFVASQVGAAETWRYCADAERLQEDPPLIQTKELEFRVAGLTAPPELRQVLAAGWARQRVWTEGGVTIRLRVLDDAAACPASLGHRVAMDVVLTQELLDEARQMSRDISGVESPRFRSLASQFVTAVTEQLGIAAAAKPLHWFTVHYATNRKRLAEGDERLFANGEAAALSLGSIRIGVPHRPHMDRIVSAAVERIDQVTNVTSIRLGALSPAMSVAQWQADIARHAHRDGERGIMVFIHGFNNSLAEAAQRAAQLTYDLGWPGATAVFSWPSNAWVWDYRSDGRIAESSRDSAREMLDILISLPKDAPIYIVAHSMGNRVMLAALTDLLEKRPDARERIRQVVMAAPDVPIGWYQQRYEMTLSASGIPTTLYTNRFDRAVKTAPFADGERTWKKRVPGTVRLGAGGDTMIVRPYLDSVDASQAAREIFGLNHSYFGDHTKVVSDLFRLMRKGEPAANRSGKTIDPRGKVAGNGWVVRVQGP